MRGRILTAILLLALLFSWGCGAENAGTTAAETEEYSVDMGGGLVWQQQLTLEYAACFHIDLYEGGYCLLTESDGTQILTIPEGAEVPAGISEDILVLQLPLEGIYLAASAAADLLAGIGALDKVSFSSLKTEDWSIEAMRSAMEQGDILYAGKYSTPDYELLVTEGCQVAVENMMISHAPEVIDKLEALDIPVIIDRASMETHPLGRLEWIKFYGALTGHLQEAVAVYEEQAAQAADLEETGCSVAFFYLRNDGAVVVRRSDDYVAEMIRIAGGRYILDDATGDNLLSTTVMQMEEFYMQAKDVDYIVYNATITRAPGSVGELLEMSPSLADFTAVQEDRVYIVAEDMYQSTMSIGTVIADLHRMMIGAPEEELVFLRRLAP